MSGWFGIPRVSRAVTLPTDMPTPLFPPFMGHKGAGDEVRSSDYVFLGREDEERVVTCTVERMIDL